MTTEARGSKGLYYTAGLAEGAETIAVFALMMLFPAWFPAIAYAFAAICLVTAMARAVIAWGAFGDGSR